MLLSGVRIVPRPSIRCDSLLEYVSCFFFRAFFWFSPIHVPFYFAAAGVYGASVGTAVLDAMGVDSDNLVPRGIAMGASAHSIGTAALMEQEPEVCEHCV